MFEYRLLQLSLTFVDMDRKIAPPDGKRTRFQQTPTTVRFQALPPMTRGAASTLQPHEVIRGILLAIRDENAKLGTNYFPTAVHFCQTDFDCYDIYNQAARLIIHRLAEHGEFFRVTLTTSYGDIQVRQPDFRLGDEFEVANL